MILDYEVLDCCGDVIHKLVLLHNYNKPGSCASWRPKYHTNNFEQYGSWITAQNFITFGQYLLLLPPKPKGALTRWNMPTWILKLLIPYQLCEATNPPIFSCIDWSPNRRRNWEPGFSFNIPKRSSFLVVAARELPLQREIWYQIWNHLGNVTFR